MVFDEVRLWIEHTHRQCEFVGEGLLGASGRKTAVVRKPEIGSRWNPDCNLFGISCGTMKCNYVC